MEKTENRQYETIQRIHATPHKAVLVITGGGAGAINELLQYGGGSATVLEATVPYDQHAFDRYVKGHPDKYCSPEAARDLAMAAYQRGIQFDDTAYENDHVIGLGATCSLMKNEQEREGREHHVHIGIQTRQVTQTLWYKIDGLFASRSEEEYFASNAIIDALSHFSLGTELGEYLTLIHGEWQHGSLKINERVEDGNAEGELALWPLLDERKKHFVEFGNSPVLTELQARSGLPRIILSGSFRPLHQGHIDMAKAGFGIYGHPVDLEICVHNVDKPTLNYGEMIQRVDGIKQQAGDWLGSTLLTNAATFVEKAEMFPTAKFLVGFDTLKRIGMEKYYYNRHHMLDCFRRIKELGCVFLVFHRMTTQEGVVNVTDAKDFAELPQELQEISFIQQTVPTAISSTEIRNGKK